MGDDVGEKKEASVKDAGDELKSWHLERWAQVVFVAAEEGQLIVATYL